MLDDVPIEEADLYKYQRYRWLSREAEKLAVRYRKFKLPALLDAAVNVTGLKDAQCIKVLKCMEGQYNKALVLTMSTGQEIVARLPNPNAGPAFYTTASEVATRQFLRDYLEIPIPRIYAWSAEDSNAVGAEYILEEKATGQPLGSLWDTLPLPSRLDIVKQIVDIEKKLASITFPKHGCIYYQSDLESRHATPSFASVPDNNPGLPKFAIGPLTHPKYWQGKRALMELDRGPWNSIADYAVAVGKNEIQWAEENAQPRMNFQRSPEEPETPGDYISLLQRYTKLAPFLVPPSASSEQTITISHPDLHLDNVFIDPQTNHITSIIDWQHASASPIFLQRPFPQMLELSRNPQAERQVIEKRLLEFYFEALKSTDPFRWKVLGAPFHDIRTEPISLVPCCWDREDLFSLRNAMIAAVARWNDISDGKTECPIGFTEKELEQHQNEMELIEGVSMILHQLHDDGFISLGGMVSPERYEDARKWNEYFKQEFIDLAEDEKQRELHAKVWPY
ncbi:phosphotransferase enzyme [Aspergillus viridinutans]|uniref:Phosphotransferase enzyme n=1 Tax=Aspergillus viridinutans TaxID=75553 RepID=A0A9P3BUF5_ASPVI|nr:phosphotransferase enzyme [Aspergillus viridinutans]GIK02212.1 phosphotransferase enzyme [Aspergillus viridinutans]